MDSESISGLNSVQEYNILINSEGMGDDFFENDIKENLSSFNPTISETSPEKKFENSSQEDHLNIPREVEIGKFPKFLIF